MRQKDRDYYRAQRNSELREELNYGINVDWYELAVVLEERLYAELTQPSRSCDCDCC